MKRRGSLKSKVGNRRRNNTFTVNKKDDVPPLSLQVTTEYLDEIGQRTDNIMEQFIGKFIGVNDER